MKVVIDTNVLISGIFFSGLPYEILNAWRNRKFELAISPDIFEEYMRVGEFLAMDHPQVNPEPMLNLIAVEAELISAPPLNEKICKHSADDKFIACAIAAKATIIISGDKHLLEVNGCRNLSIMRPRSFLDFLDA